MLENPELAIHQLKRAVSGRRGDVLQGADRVVARYAELEVEDAAMLCAQRGDLANAHAYWLRARDRGPHRGYVTVNEAYCRFKATGDAAAAELLVELVRGRAKGVAWIEALVDEIQPGWRDG